MQIKTKFEQLHINKSSHNVFLRISNFKVQI